MQCLLSEKVWTKEEHLHAALNDNLTAEALRAFIPDFFGRMYLEIFAHGNLSPEHAKELRHIVDKGLGGKLGVVSGNCAMRMRQTSLKKKTTS